MIHTIVWAFQLVAILGCVSSCIYYAICLWSAVLFLRHQKGGDSFRGSQSPPVSILKPLKGTDPDIYESFRSHCLQDYPEYELIFGVSDANDPAVASVQRLQQEFPSHAIYLVVCQDILGANVKVSNLERMLQTARYAHLIVNDSDISVPPDYIRDVTAPLSDPAVGLVTCLYRAEAHDWPSRFEALAVATDFAPSTLIAPWFGVSEFGPGSTLAFRKTDLERIGGFRTIADYLADDYQLGCKLHSLGLRNVISKVVVSTRLSAESWSAAWRHQLRWALTIRLSRGGGYAGLPVTFATVWAVLAACRLIEAV